MASPEHFRALHHGEDILLMANAWDVGSAKLLEHLGFRALATTSGGAAAARGVNDGDMDRETVLAHGAELAAAVEVPVSADLENGFAHDPTGVADTIGRARATGLAGASIEDWSGTAIYDRAHAVERVQAAVEAAEGSLVVTARAENHFRGVDDLDDTIARLRAYREAGAHVVYAPGLSSLDDIAQVVRETRSPVNVLALHGGPGVRELASVGVRRVSTGGALAWAAYGALVSAGRELLESGTSEYTEGAVEQALREQALGR
jgi:2-methylisocitrate lyase-like PEP mutase family enzyme